MSTDSFFFLVFFSFNVYFCNWASNYETSITVALQYTHVQRACWGKKGKHSESHSGQDAKEYVDSRAVRLIYADNELLKDEECSAISGLSF